MPTFRARGGAAGRPVPEMRARLRAAGLWLLVALVLWLVSALFAPAQELGYRLLVELGALRTMVGTDVLNIVIALGSLPVAAAAAALAAGVGLVRGRGRQVLRAATAAGVLLLTTAGIQVLGLHVEHGWFPHEGTFPSGHLAAFLAVWIVWRAVTAKHHGLVDAVAGAVGFCLALALLAGTAHTVWDVAGAAALGLAASRIGA